MHKPTPSKLFKLKKWLTLPESARHLSGVCGETVTEADILQLALEGQLKISVNLVNHANVKLGKVINFDDEKLLELLRQGIYPDQLDWCTVFWSDKPMLINFRIGKDQYLKTEEKVVVIEGVWDLPMIGDEKIYVEKKYHELTGGPNVELIGMDGVFVQGSSEIIICELQDQFDDDMYNPSTARNKQFHKLRRLELNKCSNRRKEKLLVLRKEKLERLTEKEESWRKLGRYYPACGLPENSILVVRTEALRGLEQLLSEDENENTTDNPAIKSNGHKERHAQNREQILGAAFAVLAKWPDKCRDTKGEPVASKIANLVEAKANLFWPDSQDTLIRSRRLPASILRFVRIRSSPPSKYRPHPSSRLPSISASPDKAWSSVSQS
ncbi:MAG: hypothetical protein Q7T96_09400 [Methylobacter sp.]|nr:hypothetical protein [Methylobacter sp.]